MNHIRQLLQDRGPYASRSARLAQWTAGIIVGLTACFVIGGCELGALGLADHFGWLAKGDVVDWLERPVRDPDWPDAKLANRDPDWPEG